jgi:hypothetical protein
MFKNLTRLFAMAGMVSGAVVMSGCGKSDTPPMGKIEVQYRQMVSGRYIGRHSELANLKITNVRCKDQGGRSFRPQFIEGHGRLHQHR